MIIQYNTVPYMVLKIEYYYLDIYIYIYMYVCMYVCMCVCVCL